MNLYKRLILVGKAASGKDYARKIIEEFGFRYCVSHTTRPPRNGEVDGKDYHFVSLDAMNHHYIPGNLLYEYVMFNGWIYGTSRKEFEGSNLFIMTPGGIKKMDPMDRKESFIVYIDIDIETRRKRLSERNDADILERRLMADEKDFENFIDFDHRITKENFDISDFSDFLKIIKK